MPTTVPIPAPRASCRPSPLGRCSCSTRRSNRGWGEPARRSPSERFALDVRLPARLPGWVDVEPCPREHLAAMRDACWLLCDHAELAVADLERAAGTERGEAVGRVREALAQTRSAADYAARLHADTMTPELHRRTEATIKRAVEGAYRIGQLAAMPDRAGARRAGL